MARSRQIEVAALGHKDKRRNIPTAKLQGASDEKVYEVSIREGRALVTLDRDLGQVLRFPVQALE